METNILHTVLTTLQTNYLLLIPFAVILLTLHSLLHAIFLSPLNHIPGPFLYSLTKWRLALTDYIGTRTPQIHALHNIHGPVVRLSPCEVSFSSLTALRQIYGAGSGFERTAFYRLFDVYGRQNMFTFASPREHGDRKKLLNHVYSKSVVLKGRAARLVEEHVAGFLEMIERERGEGSGEVFRSLHYYSLDCITGFLYGGRFGGTKALEGDLGSRALLDDILDPARRKATWFSVHLPRYTKWLYSRTGVVETVVTGLGMLPMRKPTLFTGIRAHALKAWKEFEAAGEEEQIVEAEKGTIMGRLWRHMMSEKEPKLDGLDIASEVADHFLAGIDTTSDTLMFLIWALSRPEHRKYQERLMAEVDAIKEEECNEAGTPRPEIADKLPYLDAVIKETLRLYAPLPASEPRSLPTPTTIDGYHIPAGTTVSISPYTLHRNASIFPNPLSFRPERWLGEYKEDDGVDVDVDLTEMKKWFWAFSSGGRMCIGLHLAMLEMTTLVAAIYRRFETRLGEEQVGVSPGITSRFEVFCDEGFERVKEHSCWIDFQKREKKA